MCSKEIGGVASVCEEDLIDVVNALQNKLSASGHSLDVDLPLIAVVGCQSAGKSSVLENFVGKEFLPRGAGTVTRRPTVVQMHPTDGEEFGVFVHLKDRRFTDFAAIRQEIVDESLRDPGTRGFSSVPINLQIYTHRALKLTVVDLPGLVKNVEDDEDASCIAEVRDMVLSYIRKPESIILAVSPANHDLANSDALDIAKIADPERSRTIGVLTKLDIMDRGTDATDILENHKHSLQRGYVGVLNRSQQDIREGRDIRYILDKEAEFFANTECYSHLSHRMGTPYLQKLLQKTLRAHIKQFLPKVRAELQQKLARHQRELKELEARMGDGSMGKQYYVIKVVQSFVEDVRVQLLGNSELASRRDISAGAAIHHMMHTQVQRHIDLTLVPKEEELAVLIANLSAIRTSVGVPNYALESMCRELVSEYNSPVERCVRCVADVLDSTVEKSAALLKQYPLLQCEILCLVRGALEREAENTVDRLRGHVDAEMFYVNLEHPDFDAALCAPVAPTAGPIKMWGNFSAEGDFLDEEATHHMKKALRENEAVQNQARYLTALLAKYLGIVKKQMGDLLVKYVLHFLVKKVLDFVRADLVPTLLDTVDLVSLTADCADDFKRKDELVVACESLRNALAAVRSF